MYVCVHVCMYASVIYAQDDYSMLMFSCLLCTYVCTVCMTEAYLQLLTRSHERDSLNVSLLVFLSGAKLSTYVLEMRLMTVCKDA